MELSRDARELQCLPVECRLRLGTLACHPGQAAGERGARASLRLDRRPAPSARIYVCWTTLLDAASDELYWVRTSFGSDSGPLGLCHGGSFALRKEPFWRAIVCGVIGLWPLVCVCSWLPCGADADHGESDRRPSNGVVTKRSYCAGRPSLQTSRGVQ